MTYKNTERLDRLVAIGRDLWNSLTEDEKEAYYLDRGSFGFMEDVMTILRIPAEEFESPEHFEYIHDLIRYHKGDLTMFKPKTIKFYDHEGLSYKTQKFLTKNRYYHDEIADKILDFIATLDKSMETIELGWGRFYVSDRNYWALKRLWYKANKELCQYLKYTAEIALEEDE